MADNDELERTLWAAAIIEAKAKSFHNRLIYVCAGCAHFVAHRLSVESA